MTAPKIDKDAGVEALFWNVHVEDEISGDDVRRVLRHYLRLKVFDEKGKEKAATIDVEFGGKTSITNIGARTIKADGTIVEMKKDAVFQRDLVRAGGQKVKVKSFAVPAVEPGAIVEYRYTENQDHADLYYARYQMQREYPVQKVTYFVKPLDIGLQMALWSFHCQPSPLKKERDGYSSLSLENVPAFREEPMMFSEANVRPFVLVHYRKDEKRDPDKYWTQVGKSYYDRLKLAQKVNDDLKKTVAELVAGAKSDEEKVSSLVLYDFRGWLIPPGGGGSALAKEKVADIALSSDNTYDEGRAKVLSPGSGLAPGTVFAYEVTEEEKSVFTQYTYGFQQSMPVLLSRFVLSAPAGWEVRGTVFNHDPLEPAVAGGTYTWELRNLPWIEDERYSPDLQAVAPRLGVSYFPGDNKAGLRPLKDWPAVSSWVTELVDPAAEVSDAIHAKSAELTRGAISEVDKIRALGRFAQQVNYVSVQLNVTRGAGYTPHRADQVLARNYGDCKDKATLMRALLQAAGVGSYLTLIYSSDRLYVRPEWASPQQFDHAIVAVKVSPETNLATVFQHPRLGRLLMFDPTDSDTPLGDLPQNEQGSHALIAAGAQGELVEMPLLPPTTNRIESLAEASMDPAGSLQVHLDRHYFGQSAASAHARVVGQTNDDLRRSYERSLGRHVGAIAVKQAAISGVIADGQMQLSLDYTAEHFSQNMSGLMIIKPGSLALGADYTLTPGERKLPVKLDADEYKDTVRIKLPAGLKIDEMPDPVRLDSKYGTYQASWKAEGSDLVFEQSTQVKDALVPPAQYADLRAFFDKINGSQSSPSCWRRSRRQRSV